MTQLPMHPGAEKEWMALLEAWQAARAAELVAFPTIGRGPSPAYIEALESYLACKGETYDVVIRMLDLLRREARPWGAMLAKPSSRRA